MNESGQSNNGEKPSDFPLVRRPSSALEKAAPAAKLIISGMVDAVERILRADRRDFLHGQLQRSVFPGGRRQIPDAKLSAK
jgi:hypothetical protein